MKKTYQNNPELKELFVAETIKHRKQDDFIRGTYHEEGTNFKGCSVGCAIETTNRILKKDFGFSDHSALEEVSLYPEWLARLQDTIFEGLPEEDSKKWSEQFAKAIPVGVSFKDMEVVKWKFCAYLIRENIKRVKELKDLDEDVQTKVIDASKQVLKVHTDAIKTGEWDKGAAWSAARSARSAAWSAWSAARSAWSAAESVARSAARSARSAARSAAWSAAESVAESVARSAAESVARSAAYKKHAKKLLGLLKSV